MAFTRKRTAVGSKLAGPKPVVLPSEKKENAGQDPNVSLVPHKRGVWGSLTSGPKPDDQHTTQEVEASHDGGQPGTLPAHAPSSGGPAWGGAGLPERIQEQAKDSASDEMAGEVSHISDRVNGDVRHAHGHLRQWDEFGGRQMHDSQMRPPPPPPPHANSRRSDSEHHPYPPRAPPPPGPPPPGPLPHHAPRGGQHGPPDYPPAGPQSGMPPHASHNPRTHPRRELPDPGKRHPGFSPEGNFTAKLEAMSGRGGSHGPPPESHPHRRGPAEPRSGTGSGRHGTPPPRAAPGNHVTVQQSTRDADTGAEDRAATSAQAEPQQARSVSAASQDAAAALATAAAAAAAAALQRPPPAPPAAPVPVVSAPVAAVLAHDGPGPTTVPGPAPMVGPAPVQGGLTKPMPMGAPVMHLVQGQPIPHGMQSLPPGVTVVPMMAGVQQQTTSHMMAPGMHPATMPVTMHMGPAGMMPVISSHGQPVPGAVYQHMPMAHPHPAHQVPPQALMHPQVMLVQHPGGVPVQPGVRPQHAVMGPALPQGPHSAMPQQRDAQVPSAAASPAATPSGGVAEAGHDDRRAPIVKRLAPVNTMRPAAPHAAGHSDASQPRVPGPARSGQVKPVSVQPSRPVDQSEAEKPAMVSKWSRPPNSSAMPSQRQVEEKQLKDRAPATAEAEAYHPDHPSKRRAGRREDGVKGQVYGRGQMGVGRNGRRPDADAEVVADSQHRPDRGGRGRGRRDRTQGAESAPDGAAAGRGNVQPAELSVEGEASDAGRGRGRGRGWGRGAGRGMGRGGRWEVPLGERPHGASEALHASDDAGVLTDPAVGRGGRQPGRGRGRRSGTGRDNGRGPEVADRDAISRGDRSATGEGAASGPPADVMGHDARNGVASSRASGPGRGRRTTDPSRTQGRSAGRQIEASQARRREGGDSAVNVESAAAAAQAAAAAASASAEIAPQVFTQALAKIEAFKIPDLPQASKPSESKSKDLNRNSKSRKSRVKSAVIVDGNTTVPK